MVLRCKVAEICDEIRVASMGEEYERQCVQHTIVASQMLQSVKTRIEREKHLPQHANLTYAYVIDTREA